MEEAADNGALNTSDSKGRSVLIANQNVIHLFKSIRPTVALYTLTPRSRALPQD
jgi:hypothetical protein